MSANLHTNEPAKPKKAEKLILRSYNPKSGNKSNYVHSHSFQIDSINPEVLCPPSSNGEAQELWLQLLCAILAFMILLVALNLAYDCNNYNNRGQLPRLAQYSDGRRCPKCFSC
jgi:hypothetical protein